MLLACWNFDFGRPQIWMWHPNIFGRQGVNFVWEACKLSIVNWAIFITYIMYVNAMGEPLESFVFVIYFIEFSDDFGTLPKFALPALHFSNSECCIMCYCWIERNTTVLWCFNEIFWQSHHPQWWDKTKILLCQPQVTRWNDLIELAVMPMKKNLKHSFGIASRLVNFFT